MPAASMATSQSFTSAPVPTATILPSAMTMVSPPATGEAMSPLRIFPMLKTATFTASDPPLAHRRVVGGATDPRIEPAAIGDAKDDGDLVVHRRVRQHDRHAVVVRAHVDV